MEQALSIIKSGGVLIYPTETLYAVGCDAMSADACSRVVRLKERPDSKPLPVIVGDMDGLSLVAGGPVQDEVRELARRFWPGPLSILVRAAPGLPRQVMDTGGFTSVRWTAHPLAQALCREAGTPLVATSANRSGLPAAARPWELDAALRARVNAVLEQEPWPMGGMPSTVVRIEEPGVLRLIRAGAVAIGDLMAAGFSVV